MNNAPEPLKSQVRHLIATNLMLPSPADSLADDTPLFDPAGLGLDSVDALQLVVALDKQYGLKIPDANAARAILTSVNTIAAALAKHQADAGLSCCYPATSGQPPSTC